VKHHALKARLFLLFFRPVFGPRSLDLFVQPSPFIVAAIPFLIYDIPPNCILPPASSLSYRSCSSKTSYQYFSSCGTSQKLAKCNTQRWCEYLVIIKHIACDSPHKSQPSEAQKISLCKLTNPLSTHRLTITVTKLVMLFNEIIAVFLKIPKKHKYILGAKLLTY